MDISIYQDALINVEAFGQNINAALQTAAETWAQGFNFFGGNTAEVEGGAEVTGLSSQIGADIDALVSTDASSNTEAAPSTDEGLEIGLETGVEANL